MSGKVLGTMSVSTNSANTGPPLAPCPTSNAAWVLAVTPSWFTASTTPPCSPSSRGRCLTPSAAMAPNLAPSNSPAATTPSNSPPSPTSPATACSPSSSNPWHRPRIANVFLCCFLLNGGQMPQSVIDGVVIRGIEAASQTLSLQIRFIEKELAQNRVLSSELNQFSFEDCCENWEPWSAVPRCRSCAWALRVWIDEQPSPFS